MQLNKSDQQLLMDLIGAHELEDGTYSLICPMRHGDNTYATFSYKARRKSYYYICLNRECKHHKPISLREYIKKYHFAIYENHYLKDFEYKNQRAMASDVKIHAFMLTARDIMKGDDGKLVENMYSKFDIMFKYRLENHKNWIEKNSKSSDMLDCYSEAYCYAITNFEFRDGVDGMGLAKMFNAYLSRCFHIFKMRLATQLKRERDRFEDKILYMYATGDDGVSSNDDIVKEKLHMNDIIRIGYDEWIRTLSDSTDNKNYIEYMELMSATNSKTFQEGNMKKFARDKGINYHNFRNMIIAKRAKGKISMDRYFTRMGFKGYEGFFESFNSLDPSSVICIDDICAIIKEFDESEVNLNKFDQQATKESTND